ncbi:MAG: HU family DNA-binding protein [Puniceicoccales bacterium]|jgi:DNA-binding protein HU-beta|nr:HU family DNA-binding protein [Puniceicoccales bacterium]
MNKAELVEEVKKYMDCDCSKACAEKALNAVLQAITYGLKSTKGVQLIGFGTFTVVKRASRTGVNPKTKAKIQIPASKTVKFRPGSKLKSCVAK